MSHMTFEANRGFVLLGHWVFRLCRWALDPLQFSREVSSRLHGGTFTCGHRFVTWVAVMSGSMRKEEKWHRFIFVHLPFFFFTSNTFSSSWSCHFKWCCPSWATSFSISIISFYLLKLFKLMASHKSSSVISRVLGLLDPTIPLFIQSKPLGGDNITVWLGLCEEPLQDSWPSGAEFVGTLLGRNWC